MEKLKFNHEDNSSLKACGIKEKNASHLELEIKKNLVSECRNSKTVEFICKKIDESEENKRIVAFLLVIFLTEDLRKSMASDIIEKDITQILPPAAIKDMKKHAKKIIEEGTAPASVIEGARLFLEEHK